MPFGPIVQKRTPYLFTGRLRHRIDIVVPTRAQDSTGGWSVNNNTVFAKRYASVEAMSGNEGLATGAQTATGVYQIVVRYIGAAPNWVPLTEYVNHALVKDRNGNLQQAQNAGAAGATVPVWSTTLNGTTTDGAITWKNIGPAPRRTGLTSAMQIQWQGRQFQITAVLDPDGRKKMLVIMALEINDSRQQNPLLPGTPGSYNPTTLQDVVNEAVVDAVNDIDGGSF